jgi:antagonist of KipI
MSILVEAPGLLTTIQDLGRHGYQHLGVGPGGAMDEVSHRFANLLAGNSPEMPSLEITLAGPILRFETESLFALCGGDLSPRIEQRPVPLWRPVMVRAGARLSFGKPIHGARCYLGVGGGFKIPRVMGSASTNLAAAFGGFRGRRLRAGDRLDAEPFSKDLCPSLLGRFRRQGASFLGAGWFAPWIRELDFVRPSVLRVIQGPQWGLLTAPSRAAFLDEAFQVAPNSDRMGLRLQGSKLVLEKPLEMISSGVTAGTVQLPPDGSPILLMADRQTIGGYPRIGELAAVDIPKAAQLRPGESLRFKPITLEEAQELYLRRAARRRDMEKILADRMLQ